MEDGQEERAIDICPTETKGQRACLCCGLVKVRKTTVTVPGEGQSYEKDTEA